MEGLKPSALQISNDSAAHSHHKAMAGSTSSETHFRCVRSAFLFKSLYSPLLTACSLNIISDAFKSKMQPARHRMVYSLLKEELERPGGIHALQLRTKTPDEADRRPAKEPSGA